MIRLFTKPLRRWQAKLLLASATAVLLSGGALAYYVSTGSGFGSASVGGMNAPTDIHATATPGSGTVPVTWTASAGGGGTVAPQGYYVTRRNTDTSSTSPACGTSPTSLTAGTNCNDTIVPNGTYTYTVTAVLHTWTASSVPSSSVTVVNETTPPTTALSLVSPSHAVLSGSGPYTLYYNGDTSGSFEIADQVTDGGSGPASANFPSVINSGWSGHTSSELVTAGTGSAPTITYTSSGTQLYQWSPGASNPGSQTVTAKDAAGNATDDTVNFVSDTTAPVNGALTVNGTDASTSGSTSFSTTTNFTIGSRTDFTDGGSGIASSALTVQSFALANNSCGAAAGPSSSPTTISNTTQPVGITGGYCYAYTLTGTDNVGNAASISTTVMDDTSAPTFTITASGTDISTNGTSAIFFKSVAGSSFTITAADPESGVSSTTFPGCPANWTKSTGTNSVTCMDTTSAAAGSMNVSAADNAGSATNLSVSISADITGPTNSLSLTNQTGGSFLNGSTVYYDGANTGSFTIQNALTDAGSGPASSTFGDLGGTSTGWTFTGTTVATPAGGAYTSNTLHWNAATNDSPTEAVTGTDNLGNTTDSNLTFTNDNTAPSGGSVTVPTFVSATSVPVTFSAGTDSGSGINAASGQLSRATGTYASGSDTCSDFGVFSNIGPTGVASPYADTSVSANTCYEYTYTVSDNVGNSVTYTSGPIAVDTTAPTVSSLTLTNGSGTAGMIDKGDTITVVFSEQMSASSFCSTWTTGDTNDQSLTGNADVTLTDGGASNDTLTVSSGTCTFNFGSINLGSTAYITGGNATFSGGNSGINWTASTHTLVIVLGAQSGSGTTGTVASSTAVYTPSSSITDSAGNAVTGTAVTDNVQGMGLSSSRELLWFAVLACSVLALITLLTMPMPRRRRARRRKEN